MTMVAKIRRSSGNVFEDLGFDAEDAAHLKIRGTLMMRVHKLIKDRGLTQTQAAQLFGVTQPRISDLVRGQSEPFSIDVLEYIVAGAECRVSLVVREDCRVA